MHTQPPGRSSYRSLRLRLAAGDTDLQPGQTTWFTVAVEGADEDETVDLVNKLGPACAKQSFAEFCDALPK